MKKNKLLVILLQSEKFLTSKEIADAVGCSIRTVKSYIDDIEVDCHKHGVKLIRKKGTGFFIEGDNKVKKRIIELYSKDIKESYSAEERFLYILYLLLFDGDKLTVSELSELLYISRPSVYKEIERMSTFLKKYDVAITNKRNEGLQLVLGEKRKRLLMTKWVKNVNLNFVTNKANRDNFQLVHSMNNIMADYDEKFFKDMILRIKEEIGLDFSLHELEWMTHIFYFSVKRFNLSYEVTLLESRIQLMKELDNQHIICMIIDEIEKKYEVRLSEVEAIYLYTILVVQSSEFPENSILLPFQLYDEIKTYIDQTIVVDDESKNNLISGVISLLRKEVNYQINNNYYSVLVDYYKNLESSFGITAVMAKAIIDICTKYYSIRMTEQLICNIIFTIARVMEHNKKALKAVLIHDCNEIELHYIKEKITRYISFVDVVDESYEVSSCSEFDIALSTKEVNVTDIPLILFNKNINHLELDNIYVQCNKYYQKMNYLKLIREAKSVPENVCK